MADRYVELDIQYKYDRDNVRQIADWSEPLRRMPSEIPEPQLFNVADDPEERNDLASQNQDRARRMRDRLDSWFEEVESERQAISPENRQPETKAARIE